MNYEDLDLQELRSLAKERGVSAGNSGKEKIIEKLKESDSLNNVLTDDTDLLENEISIPMEKGTAVKVDTPSLLNSITDAIDELDESSDDTIEEALDDLSLDTVIPVKSITFGGLTYKSRTTNAMFKWSQIGAVEYMTVGELNEMNNYKRDFLNRPMVILMDEKAVKKFRLTPVYENVAKINNLKTVFSSDMRTIEKTIEIAIAVNMREILISKVRQMIKNHTLVDINVIRLLESKLKFDLSDDL